MSNISLQKLSMKKLLKQIFTAAKTYDDDAIIKNTILAFSLSLLLLFNLCLVAGKDPRLKVFVIAEDQKTFFHMKEEIEQISPNIVVYGLEDEKNELPLLAKLNCIGVLVLVYENNPQFFLKEEIVHTMVCVDRCIILLKNYSLSEKEKIVSTLRSRLPPNTGIIDNEQQLLGYIKEYSSRRHSINLLGVEWNLQQYIFFVRVISIVSLIVLFIGQFLITSMCIVMNNKSYEFPIESFLSALLISGAIFLIMQLSYRSCSALLEIPLSLHCTKAFENPFRALTAINFLGPFGGGTIPRLLASLLGSFTAVCFFGWTRSKRELIPKIFLIGLFFSTALLMFTFATVSYGSDLVVIKYFFDRSADFVQYYQYWFVGLSVISRGIMLLFIGVAMICAFRNASDKIYSFFAPFSVVLLAWGGMRIGNMNFEQTLNSFIAGLITSLGIYFILTTYLSFENNARYLWSNRKIVVKMSLSRKNVLPTYCLAIGFASFVILLFNVAGVLHQFLFSLLLIATSILLIPSVKVLYADDVRVNFLRIFLVLPVAVALWTITWILPDGVSLFFIFVTGFVAYMNIVLQKMKKF